VSEKEEKNQEEKKERVKKPMVRKGFGNTIILFIIFFIIFTLLVTGVAFFADRFNISGDKEIKDLEKIDKTEMTDPEKEGKSTEYVLDDKGNVGTKEEIDKIKEREKEAVKKEESKTKNLIKPIPELDKKSMPIPRADGKDSVKKPVKKKVVKAKPKPKPKKGVKKASTKSSTGLYTVQIASFRDRANAVSEQRRLRSMLPDVEVVRVDLGAKGVWYRLRAYVGVSLAEARSKSAEIAKRTRYKPYPLKK